MTTRIVGVALAVVVSAGLGVLFGYIAVYGGMR